MGFSGQGEGVEGQGEGGSRVWGSGVGVGVSLVWRVLHDDNDDTYHTSMTPQGRSDFVALGRKMSLPPPSLTQCIYISPDVASPLHTGLVEDLEGVSSLLGIDF